MFAYWIATDLLLRFVRYKFNGILRVVPSDIRECMQYKDIFYLDSKDLLFSCAT